MKNRKPTMIVTAICKDDYIAHVADLDLLIEWMTDDDFPCLMKVSWPNHFNLIKAKKVEWRVIIFEQKKWEEKSFMCWESIQVFATHKEIISLLELLII